MGGHLLGGGEVPVTADGSDRVTQTTSNMNRLTLSVHAHTVLEELRIVA